MIVGFICHCYGAERKIRSIFRDAGRDDYMSLPVITGPKAAEAFIANLPATLQENKYVTSLLATIKEPGGYRIIAGFTDTQCLWTSVKNSNNLVELVDAENIIDAFGKL